VGIEDAGASGVRRHGRRGSDDRAAGTGLRMAVGMAMAEKHLACGLQQAGIRIVNHYTYALCGDGD
jgi:hypothetical protein